nr:hypothetical protein [Streptomyces sp. S3(2020)]
MITRPDDDPDLDPDDPLTILLRPPADHLGPPPGRYEAIRSGATRRRLGRAAAGAAVVCGLAAAVLLPLRLTASEAPATPTVPLAPPPASSGPSAGPPSTVPPTAVPSSSGRPSAVPSEPATSVPVSPGTPSASPSMEPTAATEPTPTEPTPSDQP